MMSLKGFSSNKAALLRYLWLDSPQSNKFTSNKIQYDNPCGFKAHLKRFLLHVFTAKASLTVNDQFLKKKSPPYSLNVSLMG